MANDILNDYITAKSAMETNLEQMTTLKQHLAKELEEIESEMTRLQTRKQQILESLDSANRLSPPSTPSVPVAPDLNKLQTLIIRHIKKYPGCNGSDIRDSLNGKLYSENQIKAAITSCSAAGLIFNSGSKRWSEWYITQ